MYWATLRRFLLTTAATTALACSIAAAAYAAAATTGPLDDPLEPAHVQPGANLARVLFRTRATLHSDGGRVVARLRPQAPLGGGSAQLRVVGQKVVRGRLRVRVLLAQRPNGASGWIPGDDVVLSRTSYRLLIDRARRLLSVTRNGRTVRRFRAVVGKAASPTPVGEFAISELLPQLPADDFLGTWVLPLTAFSGTYRQFEGGPGRVAIHGRSGSSLADPLGSAASHGCIRLDNAAIEWIAGHVSAGTAVSIR